MLPENAPLVTALDDTRLPKSGRKIPGVGYGRDPMSPPFHVNLVLGQRFVQLSAMVPAGLPPGPARGVPVRFHHQPPVPKPKASARRAGEKSLSKKVCPEQPLHLRTRSDPTTSSRNGSAPPRQEPQAGGHRRWQLYQQDGASEPSGSDHLHRPNPQGCQASSPTPGRINSPKSEANAAMATAPPRRRNCGKMKAPRGGRSKRMPPGRRTPSGSKKSSRSSGGRPGRIFRSASWSSPRSDIGCVRAASCFIASRLTLLCSDLDLPIAELLQYYLWRWDIEVNHRDEKQLIGVGQGPGLVASVGGPSAGPGRRQLRLPALGGVAGLWSQRPGAGDPGPEVADEKRESTRFHAETSAGTSE